MLTSYCFGIKRAISTGELKLLMKIPALSVLWRRFCDGLSMYDRMSVRAMTVDQPVNMIVDDFPLRMFSMGVASAVIKHKRVMLLVKVSVRSSLLWPYTSRAELRQITSSSWTLNQGVQYLKSWIKSLYLWLHIHDIYIQPLTGASIQCHWIRCGTLDVSQREGQYEGGLRKPNLKRGMKKYARSFNYFAERLSATFVSQQNLPLFGIEIVVCFTSRNSRCYDKRTSLLRTLQWVDQCDVVVIQKVWKGGHRNDSKAELSKRWN